MWAFSIGSYKDLLNRVRLRMKYFYDFVHQLSDGVSVFSVSILSVVAVVAPKYLSINKASLS